MKRENIKSNKFFQQKNEFSSRNEDQKWRIGGMTSIDRPGSILSVVGLCLWEVRFLQEREYANEVHR